MAHSEKKGKIMFSQVRFVRDSVITKPKTVVDIY